MRIAAPPADFFGLLGGLCLGGLFLWARLARPGSVLPEPLYATHHASGRALRAATRLPGPVVALVTLSLLARGLDLPVETIGTRFGGIPSALPAFAWPAFSWESAQQLVIPTLTIALLGAVESLLCARVADNAAQAGVAFRRHDPNQELMA